MVPPRCLLVDLDTLTMWIFHSPNRVPIIRQEEADRAFLLLTPFVAVPHIHFVARMQREDLRPDRREEFDSLFMPRIPMWFEKVLPCHPNQALSKRWVEIVSKEIVGLLPVHEKATYEHIWLIVIAEGLRDNGRKVTIASELWDVYNAFQEKGYLKGVEILQK